MKKIIAIKLLLVSIFMMNLPMQIMAQSGEKISFQKGKYSKTVSGKVPKNSSKDYYLELKRNQKLKVRFTKKMQYVFITVKDNRGNMLKEDTNGYVEVNTTYSGDYYIEISTKYGQAENFTIIVEAR